jgi:hypothetical protein
MVREVPTNVIVPTWFWKVVTSAALCALMAVVLFAWHQSRHPRVVYVELPAACGPAAADITVSPVRSAP